MDRMYRRDPPFFGTPLFGAARRGLPPLGPLTAFLFRRASSGNQLDPLRIGGVCVGHVGGMVRRLGVDHGCLDSRRPFGPCR